MALMTPEERVRALEALEQRQLRLQTRAVRSAWTSVILAGAVLLALIALTYRQLAPLRREVTDLKSEIGPLNQEVATLTQTKTDLLKDIEAAKTARKEAELIARASASDYNVTDRRNAEVRLTEITPEACKGVTVAYYKPSAPLDYITQLEETWKSLGFRVEVIGFGIPQPMNAIWRGEAVDAECWRAVALTLIRAGIPVKLVGRPVKEASKKTHSIEIGYSGPARNNAPLTIDQLSQIQ